MYKLLSCLIIIAVLFGFPITNPSNAFADSTITSAVFVVSSEYTYSTNNSTVNNIPLNFTPRWGMVLNNNDPVQTISHLSLSADATNAGTINSYTAGGTKVGNIYTWEIDNVAPTNPAIPGTKYFLFGSGTTSLSPGFVATRQVSQEIFTNPGTPQTQTVTVTVTPDQRYPTIGANIAPQFIAGEDARASWALTGWSWRQTTNNATQNNPYIYTFAFTVTPKVSAVRFIPMVSAFRVSTQSSSSSNNTTNKSVTVTDGVSSHNLSATATTSQVVGNFIGVAQEQRAVTFNSVSEEVAQPISSARFTVSSEYTYATNNSTVNNVALNFTPRWGMALSNNDPVQTISHLRLDADAANAGTIASYTAGGTKVGNTYTWEIDNVPPTNPAVPGTKYFLFGSGTSSLSPGFVATRQVSQEIFTNPGTPQTQTVTVTVTPGQNYPTIGANVAPQFITGEDDRVSWALTGGSWRQASNNATQNNPYIYTFTFTVTPKVSAVRFIPQVVAFRVSTQSSSGSPNTTSKSVAVNDGASGHTLIGTATTSQVVGNFIGVAQEQRIVIFNSVSETVQTTITSAAFIVSSEYTYSTNNSTVNNVALNFTPRWGMVFSNNDPVQTITHLSLSADATNAGAITTTSPPGATKVGNTYTWELDNIPPTDPAVMGPKYLLFGSGTTPLSPGFVATRQVSKEVFTNPGTPQTQTVTVTVTPDQNYPTIGANVGPGFIAGEDARVSWALTGSWRQTTNNATQNNPYIYTFTFTVTPKVSAVRFIPQVVASRVSTQSSSGSSNTTSKSVTVNDVVSGHSLSGTATTSQVVGNFVGLAREQRIVTFNSVSQEVSQTITSATFIVSSEYTYATNNSTVNNVALGFTPRWGMIFNNNDPVQMISHVRLDADATTAGTIASYTAGGTKVGNIYTWEIDNVAPTNPAVPGTKYFLFGSGTTSLSPGFVATRQVSQEIFTNPGTPQTQTVTVTVTPDQNYPTIGANVAPQFITGEDDRVSWALTGGSWRQASNNATQNNPYIYTFTFTVTPKVSAVRFIPMVNAFRVSTQSASGSPNTISKSVTVNDGASSHSLIGTATTSQVVGSFVGVAQEQRIVAFNSVSQEVQTAIPAVATVTADTITKNSARLRGNLISLGSATSCQVSFLWGPTSDNLTHETTPQAMTTTGIFNANLGGLTPGTIYYFKAKAVGHGTRYGNTASFTTTQGTPPGVATVTADTITINSTRLRGNLTSLGTATSCQVSFLWGPISDNLTHETTPQAMTTTGIFNANLGGLTPGTIYYFKAKAVGDGTRYGSIVNFTTTPGTPPGVATVTADTITKNSARLRGNLTSLGTATSCQVSFLWGPTSDNLTHETTPQAMTTTGIFNANLGGLTPGTIYYFKAKAVGHGTRYGNTASFTTTQGTPPGVATVTADTITINSTRLRGNLTSLGTATSCQVSFLWGPSSDNLTHDTIPSIALTTGYFSANLSGLSPGTTYYFKAEAIGHGTRYGNTASFTTTQGTPPGVATVTADTITINSTRLRGNLTSLGTATSCQVSFLWGPTSDNLTHETTPQAMTTTGIFNANLGGLTPGTTYYFKAKAVGDGTRLGVQSSFTTRP